MALVITASTLHVICDNCSGGSTGRIAWFAAVVAALGALAAVWFARETVRLARVARREEQLRRLAEALIEVMISAEEYPRANLGSAQGRYQPFDEAQKQLKRAAALSILGLSAEVSGPVVELMEKNAWQHPNIALMKAHEAYEQLNRVTDALALAQEGWWQRRQRRRAQSAYDATAAAEVSASDTGKGADSSD